MKGDFTRDTFDPSLGRTRVLLQQGRMLLDADFNEQSAIQQHLLRTLAVDLIGPHGGPEDDCGFALHTVPGAQVHALLAGAPERLQAVNAALAQGDVLVAPGRYYVGGLLLELHSAMLLSEQSGVDAGNRELLRTIQGARAQGALLYLHVWERHVTTAEDPALRDPALGGADTCTRAQVAWRIGVLADVARAGVADAMATLQSPPPNRMQAHTQAIVSAGAGEASAASGYLGLENHLYRIEIHRGGTAGPGGASFKWSRANGAVAFQVLAIAGQRIELAATGRQERLQPGSWLELTDYATEFGGACRPLFQIREAAHDGSWVLVDAPAGLPVLDHIQAQASGAVLRQWDHDGDSDADGAVPLIETAAAEPHAGWQTLECGIAVRFADGGTYQRGDYWLLPARVQTAQIEWPSQRDAAGRVVVDAQGAALRAWLPPRGPEHRYAPLAWWDASAMVDLRRRFGPVA